MSEKTPNTSNESQQGTSHETHAIPTEIPTRDTLLSSFADKRQKNAEELAQAESVPGFKRAYEDKVEIARIKDKTEVVDAEWKRYGGDAIDAAQAQIDALNFNSDASEHILAKAALRDAKDAFYANFTTEFKQARDTELEGAKDMEQQFYNEALKRGREYIDTVKPGDTDAFRIEPKLEGDTWDNLSDNLKDAYREGHKNAREQAIETAHAEALAENEARDAVPPKKERTGIYSGRSVAELEEAVSSADNSTASEARRELDIINLQKRREENWAKPVEATPVEAAAPLSEKPSAEDVTAAQEAAKRESEKQNPSERRKGKFRAYIGNMLSGLVLSPEARQAQKDKEEATRKARADKRAQKKTNKKPGLFATYRDIFQKERIVEESKPEVTPSEADKAAAAEAAKQADEKGATPAGEQKPSTPAQFNEQWKTQPNFINEKENMPNGKPVQVRRS